MLKVLQAEIVVVCEAMPKNTFCNFPYEPKFSQFDNWNKEHHASFEIRKIFLLSMVMMQEII